MISTKNIVCTFRHLDLKDKNLALNHVGSFGTIPGPILVKYRQNKITNTGKIKQSDWLILVIGPRTALVV